MSLIYVRQERIVSLQRDLSLAYFVDGENCLLYRSERIVSCYRERIVSSTVQRELSLVCIGRFRE